MTDKELARHLAEEVVRLRTKWIKSQDDKIYIEYVAAYDLLKATLTPTFVIGITK